MCKGLWILVKKHQGDKLQVCEFSLALVTISYMKQHSASKVTGIKYIIVYVL